MDIVSARHALYAIISAIETDIRRVIADKLSSLPVGDVLSGAQRRKALGRLLSDDPGASDSQIEDLLPYLDLSDAREILTRHLQHAVRLFDSTFVDELCSDIDVLIPIRHRVAHTRPLLIEDVPNALSKARKLHDADRTIWLATGQALRDLRNRPEIFLALNLPSEPDRRVLHNLPAPDFDETGFVGREAELAQLTALCKGSYPVVTIVGEGGLGKSALALKAAYDLLDDSEDPFEIVIWSSSKTAQLTSSEIVRIEGAIESSLGLLQNVELQLVGKKSADAIEEILQYMKEFRTLIILDNLETVLDQRLRSFFGRLPTGSKVLVTSRIGLGAYEYPLILKAMVEKESRQMLRALSQARNVIQLANLDNSILDSYCRRMKYNPGFIKWFVSAVQSGKQPEEVLVKPDVFLDYCMSNVYEHLSDNSRLLLKYLQCSSRGHTQAELTFITDFGLLDLQKSVQQLLTTNMIVMRYEEVGDVLETTYQVGELAKAFLNNKYPVQKGVAKTYAAKRRQMVSLEEQYYRTHVARLYMFEHISCRTRSDALVAKHLQDAISLCKKQQFVEAKKLVESAKNMAPGYFEVYRVGAQIAFFEGNWPVAKELYQAAIEIESNWAPLRYWYAGFMLRNRDDVESALEQLEIARKIDPSSVHIGMEIARCHVYQREFDVAEGELRVLWKEPRLEAWARRKLIDLTIQLLTRRAEKKIDERDAPGALSDYLEAQNLIIACPDEYLDARIDQTIGKSAATFRRMATSSFAIPSSQDLMRAYAEWLHARLGLPGEIVEPVPGGPQKWCVEIDGELTEFSQSVYLGDLFSKPLSGDLRVRAIFDRNGYVTSMVPELGFEERFPRTSTIRETSVTQ